MKEREERPRPLTFSNLVPLAMRDRKTGILNGKTSAFPVGRAFISQSEERETRIFFSFGLTFVGSRNSIPVRPPLIWKKKQKIWPTVRGERESERGRGKKKNKKKKRKRRHCEGLG
jgi:hypothetical protein